MKIITTPMCEEIVKLSGVSDYIVNKNPDEENGDLAIVLSESNVRMKSLSLKLNTPSQVFDSIKEVSGTISKELSDEEIIKLFKPYELAYKYLNSNFKSDINVKVYSNFLKDILLDMGFNVVCDNFDYVIYPDYLKEKISETENLIEIPSHSQISKNPFERIEERYSILETLI